MSYYEFLSALVILKVNFCWGSRDRSSWGWEGSFREQLDSRNFIWMNISRNTVLFSIYIIVKDYLRWLEKILLKYFSKINFWPFPAPGPPSTKTTFGSPIWNLKKWIEKVGKAVLKNRRLRKRLEWIARRWLAETRHLRKLHVNHFQRHLGEGESLRKYHYLSLENLKIRKNDILWWIVVRRWRGHPRQ